MQAEARVELSRSNLERTARLVEQGFLSRASLDQRNADLRVGLADRDAASAEVARLAKLLNFRTVRAPLAGVVTERRAQRGSLAIGDQSQAEAFICTASPGWIDCEWPSTCRRAQPWGSPRHTGGRDLS